MALLHWRPGCLTAQTGGFRPGKELENAQMKERKCGIINNLAMCELKLGKLEDCLKVRRHRRVVPQQEIKEAAVDNIASCARCNVVNGHFFHFS